MQYRQLGRSGLLVSELCVGTMSFGASGYWETIGGLDESTAQRLVDTAIDAVSISSIPPMSTRMANPRKYSERRSERGVIRSSSPPRFADA